MLRSLINDAKAAAGSVIGKYAVRASVAVPFVVAAGFGTAALTLILAEAVGSATAYALMAGGFAAIGLIAAIAVSVKEQAESLDDAVAEQKDTAGVTSDAATQAAMQVPLALLGTLLTTPMGTGAAMGGLKMLGRNLPLVLLLGLVAVLFWPVDGDRAADAETADDTVEPELDAGPCHSPAGLDRQAA